MKTNSRIHIIVRGTVQGVFFRHSTKAVAEKLGLVGYTKNLPDGSVEIIAEGPHEKLLELDEWSKHGPKHAHVATRETIFENATGAFDTFSIE